MPPSHRRFHAPVSRSLLARSPRAQLLLGFPRARLCTHSATEPHLGHGPNALSSVLHRIVVLINAPFPYYLTGYVRVYDSAVTIPAVLVEYSFYSPACGSNISDCSLTNFTIIHYLLL
jgi:hypothetical protein